VLVVPAEDVLLDLHHARLRQARRVRVGCSGAEVNVVAVGHDATMVVRVTHDGTVGQAVLVLVAVLVAVIVTVVVSMVVAAPRPVHVVVIVVVAVLMVMIVPVHRAVRMPMLVAVPIAFDLRFAAAASACRAHSVLLGPPQAISISFTRISSPCVTCSW
jgi:hypothetical protein